MVYSKCWRIHSLEIERVCYSCKNFKRLSLFVPSKNRSNGVRSICKKCRAYREKIRRRKKNGPGGRDKGFQTIYRNGKSIEKKCSVCLSIKPVSEFDFRSRSSSGYRSYCKECRDRTLNRAAQKEYSKKYREENKEKIRQWRKKYNEENKEKRNRRLREKRKSDPNFSINAAISSRIRKQIKKGKGGKRTEEILGYKIKDLMVHLESQFEDGMSWENYGDWHVDHIKPVSFFQIESVDDPMIKECWSMKNLRPLWASENISKGDCMIDYQKITGRLF